MDRNRAKKNKNRPSRASDVMAVPFVHRVAPGKRINSICRDHCVLSHTVSQQRRRHFVFFFFSLLSLASPPRRLLPIVVVSKAGTYPASSPDWLCVCSSTY